MTNMKELGCRELDQVNGGVILSYEENNRIYYDICDDDGNDTLLFTLYEDKGNPLCAGMRNTAIEFAENCYVSSEIKLV